MDRKGRLPFVRRNYLSLSLSLFFIPPLLLLAALDFENPPIPVIHLSNIPFEVSQPGFSGEACLSMYLQSCGHDISQEQVFSRSGLDPSEGRGCQTDELIRTAQYFGLDPGPVWHSFQINSRQASLHEIWQESLQDLKNQQPSVFRILQEGQETFVLLTGYDPETDKVVFHAPHDTLGKNRRQDRDVFLNHCMSGPAGQQLTLVRLKLNSGKQLSLQNNDDGFSNADFAQHVRKLKQNLPAGDFQVVVEKPFVVIGDESLTEIKQRTKHTIKWAVDRLKQDYFSKDPNQIVDIWLFKDKTSYEKNVELLVGYPPTTKFGFYSSHHHVLVMNISTGGGTLVHEIVHPFIESNFPNCPSWFNEGLASLYEQCRDREGHIWGSTNWRLRGLQGAIESNRVPSFRELCGTTREQFYNEDPGTNYSQARYLCYYLQETGLLRKYYDAFRANVSQDPSGYETLSEILGQPDMDEFKKKWEAYVMKLRFTQ